MDNINFTLKDLIVDSTAKNFAVAFGVDKDRAEKIAEALDKISDEIGRQPAWSPSQIFEKAAKENIAINPREVAFVTYLVGCRVGEDITYQKALADFKGLIKPIFPPLKKGKYAN